MPKQFDLETIHCYLNEVTKFLAEYSWIYNVRNTDIFLCDVLQKIPTEWKEPLLNLDFNDLKRIPYNLCKDDWPKSLQRFVRDANRLAEFRYNQKLLVDSVKHVVIPDFIRKNTPYKKQNEITWMTAIIGKLLTQYGMHTVLDVGSGLGYLDQLIHHNFGVTTIGFESVTDRWFRAKQRLKHGFCADHIFHVNRKIEDTPECLESIQENLQQLTAKKCCPCGNLPEGQMSSKPTDVMIVGLHSCGDLVPNMMKLFLKFPEAKIFLCVSCCYHQLTLEDFPMSSTAKDALVATKSNFPDWSPCTTGLRLGCQTTRAYWEQMSEEKHYHKEMCLFYRAVLQNFLIKEKLAWRKPKQRMIRKKDIESFDNFASYIFQNLPWTGLVKKEKIQNFKQLCEENEHLLPNIKILNLLQMLLQPLWEGYILADRMVYFLEQSMDCRLFAMCNEQISPRNILLIATKNLSL